MTQDYKSVEADIKKSGTKNIFVFSAHIFVCAQYDVFPHRLFLHEYQDHKSVEANIKKAGQKIFLSFLHIYLFIYSTMFFRISYFCMNTKITSLLRQI